MQRINIWFNSAITLSPFSAFQSCLCVCVCVLSIDYLWNFRRLMSSASDQKLFCEVCSAFSCSFNEFVGEKVVSPIPPPSWLLPPLWNFK